MCGGASADKVYRQDATEKWYSEINKPGYDFNKPGFSKGTGHFTQVIWKATTKVGFGYAANGNSCYVCARYNCAGNLSGAFPQNVPKLIK